LAVSSKFAINGALSGWRFAVREYNFSGWTTAVFTAYYLIRYNHCLLQILPLATVHYFPFADCYLLQTLRSQLPIIFHLQTIVRCRSCRSQLFTAHYFPFAQTVIYCKPCAHSCQLFSIYKLLPVADFAVHNCPLPTKDCQL